MEHLLVSFSPALRFLNLRFFLPRIWRNVMVLLNSLKMNCNEILPFAPAMLNMDNSIFIMVAFQMSAVFSFSCVCVCVWMFTSTHSSLQMDNTVSLQLFTSSKSMSKVFRWLFRTLSVPLMYVNLFFYKGSYRYSICKTNAYCVLMKELQQAVSFAAYIECVHFPCDKTSRFLKSLYSFKARQTEKGKFSIGRIQQCFAVSQNTAPPEKQLGSITGLYINLAFYLSGWS